MRELGLDMPKEPILCNFYADLRIVTLCHTIEDEIISRFHS